MTYRRSAMCASPVHPFQAVRSGLLCPILLASPERGPDAYQVHVWAVAPARNLLSHHASRTPGRKAQGMVAGAGSRRGIQTY